MNLIKFKNTGKILLYLTFIYVLWISLCFIFIQTGIFLDIDNIKNLTDPLSIIFFMVVASFLTAVFMVYVEPFLKNQHGLRKILLISSIVIGIGFFIFVRKTGAAHSFIYIIASANLLVFANLIGTWIITPLKRPAELIPLCIIMSMADIFSIISGPTKEIAETIEKYYESGMEGPAPAGDFILFKFPVLGLEKPVPIFGLSDWIIVAFLCASAMKFGINDNLAGKSVSAMIRHNNLSFYMPVAVVGLMSAIFMAHYLGIFLPALPIISVFFISYIMIKVPKARQLKKTDIIMILSCSGIMAGLIAVRYYLLLK